MSYLLQMREFLQYEAERNYDARCTYRLEDKSYNWRHMLESLRFEAERASRCSGERPFTEIFLSSESIVHILNDEVEDVFRHIAMNLSPKTTRLHATVKEYR